MQNAATIDDSEPALGVMIIAEENSPGAELLELLLGLDPKKHSDKHPITVLDDWKQQGHTKVATAMVHVVERDQNILCTCVIGDADSLNKRAKGESNVFRVLTGHAKGSFNVRSGGIVINRYRFPKEGDARKLSMAQQMVCAAISQCSRVA